RYKNKYHKPRLYVLKEKKLYPTEMFRSLGNIIFLSDEDRIPIEKEEVKDLSEYGIVKVGEEEYYSQDYGLVWAPPQY
ncbi:MAG: hypothetical protein N2999_08125, partial [Proteobacteria bacterium]|nr:hypothetical protein [Pseudomonadota bacterium]